MKVDVATAAVAKIANKTLKLLCMVSIRGYAKNYLFNRLGCPDNGRPPLSIDMGRLVKVSTRGDAFPPCFDTRLDEADPGFLCCPIGPARCCRALTVARINVLRLCQHYLLLAC